MVFPDVLVIPGAYGLSFLLTPLFSLTIVYVHQRVSLLLFD